MPKSSFTVYFEDPFWVGLYEYEDAGQLRACKVTFGPEPKDYEVYAFLLENWHRLALGPPVPAGTRAPACKNPKRMQRQIARQTTPAGAGTKAQQALSLAREAGKQAKKTAGRDERLAEKARRRALHVQKKKEKHKGH